MNIAPITGFSNAYLKTNFKGSNNNFSSVPALTPDESQSKQNNSPEFTMSTEQYLGMMGMGIASKTFKQMEDPNSDFSKLQAAIMPQVGAEDIDPGDDFSGDFGDFDFPMPNVADTMLYSLKSTANFMSQPPEELKGKIPVFISGGSDEYIKFLESNIENIETADFSQIQLPEVEEVYEANPNLKKYGEFGEDITSHILEAMQFYMTPEMMEQMANSQKAAVEAFKTTKRDELSKAIESLNKSLNYMLYQALNAGFNRNPREVINTLTTNTMVYIEPEITDNGDGTSTYKYVNFTSVINVVRNNKNGDFVSAEATKDGKKNFEIKFREDGSIEKMDYVVFYDNSQMSFATNLQNDKLRAVQVFSDFACERIFNKQEDGTLKQVSVRIIAK